MIWLAVWLIALGVMDLARVAYSSPRWVAPVAGLATLLGLIVLCGLTAPADLVFLTVSIGPLLGWWWASGRALPSGRGHLRALGVLALGVLWLLGGSGWSSRPGGVLQAWLAWAQLPHVGVLSGFGLPHGLLVIGSLLVNLATGNTVVRLVLTAAGALRPNATGPQPADRLRGGRLLGPMERVLILGLGLAGQVTAAGLVIAAKGLIRFPELQSRAQDGSGVDGVGIDEMTEYFLVGSFVSWLFALATLALAR